jgi:hypothetical protein
MDNEEENRGVMGKMMYRMGRNDMTTTMEDMQLTP